MTDERFDRDLRAAVDSLGDVRASSALRARVDRVLSGETVVPAQRRAPTWLRAGLAMAAVVALAVVVGWTALRPAAIGTAASAGPSAVPTLAVPTPTAGASATLPADWPARIGMPLVSLPVSAVRTTTFPRDGATRAGGAVSGPFVYRNDPTASAITAITVVDLGGGSIRQIPLPQSSAYPLAATRTDGTWLAVEGVKPDVPCGSKTTFRILATKLGADGMPDTGSGWAEVRGELSPHQMAGQDATSCQFLSPPYAIWDGRLAWAEERTDGTPGSVVHVRALDRLAPDQLFKTTQFVVRLALSGDAVAWVQASRPLAVAEQMAAMTSQGPSVQFDWQVMDARLGGAAAEPVDIGQASGPDHPYLPQTIVLDGATLVVTRVESATTMSVVRVDGSGVKVIDDGMHGRTCQASGAEAGTVSLACSFPGLHLDPQGNWLMVWAVWSPSDGLRAVTVGAPTARLDFLALVQSGWLVLEGQDPGEYATLTISAVPLSALGGSAP